MPLIQSGMALVASSVLTSGLGFVFWIVAARQFSSAELGVGSAIITAMILLADTSQLGLKTGLVKFLPMAGADTRRLIVNAYVVSAVIAAATALVFVLGVDLWAPDLNVLQSSPLALTVFVLSCAFWVIFLLEDSVLLGLRMTPWVPVENGVFGLLKIILLFPLAGMTGDLGVFLAWALPVFLIVIAVNVGVDRRVAATRPSPTVRRPDTPHGPATNGSTPHPVSGRRLAVREVYAYSLVDWTATASRTVVIGILPLLVLAQLGSSQNAYYFLAWTIAYSVYILSANIGDALVAEASYDEDNLDRHTLHSGLLSMAISVPIVLVAAAAAPWVLRAFSAEYVDEATTVLRLLLLGAIPHVITRTFVGRLRAERRMTAVFVYESLLSAGVLVVGWLLLEPFGINGLGIAWLVMLTIAALYALAAESLWWWAPRIDSRVVRLGRRLFRLARRAEEFRSSPALDGEVRRRLAVRYASPPDWRRIAVSNDTQTVVVDGHQGRPPLRMELARTPSGNDQLRRRYRAVNRLMSMDALPALRAIVPYPIEYANEGDRHLLIESVISGRSGAEVDWRPVTDLVVATLEPVAELHEVTAEVVTIDNFLLERWVALPLKSLAASHHIPVADLAPIEQLLVDELDERAMTCSMIHGNLTLDNALFDPNRRLTGLINWQWTGFGPTAIDGATLALSALALDPGRDLGPLVRDLLRQPEPLLTHPAMNGSIPEIDPRALVLLGWLRHVVPRLVSFESAATGRFWIARHVTPVLGHGALGRSIPA